MDQVAAAVVYNFETNKFLLVKRAMTRERFPEKWEFPSGFFEKYENPKEAALRELEEETGLLGEVVKIGEKFSIQIPDVLVNPVLVVVESNEVELSEEHTDFEWVDLNQIERFETVPKIKQDLKAVDVL